MIDGDFIEVIGDATNAIEEVSGRDAAYAFGSGSLAQLENDLRAMKPGQRLFNLIKAKQQRRGHWKKKPRGRAFKKGADKRRHSL